MYTNSTLVLKHIIIIHNINITIQIRGYKWPIEKFVPDTPGWDRLMRRRFDQVRLLFAYD